MTPMHPCEYCGKPGYGHHVYGRRFKSLRDDPNNICYLCNEHHTNSSVFSAHRTPVKFLLWLTDRRGEEWRQRLREKAHPRIFPETA